MQAHHNAQQHAEEFVVELLVSLDKMQVLVQNLLAIEVRACMLVTFAYDEHSFFFANESMDD